MTEKLNYLRESLRFVNKLREKGLDIKRENDKQKNDIWLSNSSKLLLSYDW